MSRRAQARQRGVERCTERRYPRPRRTTIGVGRRDDFTTNDLLEATAVTARRKNDERPEGVARSHRATERTTDRTTDRGRAGATKGAERKRDARSETAPA